MTKQNIVRIVSLSIITLFLGNVFFFNLISTSLAFLEPLSLIPISIYALLTIPFIVAAITFTKHIIGINISSYQIPLFIIASAFHIGFFQTITLILSTFLIALTSRELLKNLHLHNASKTAIIISMNTLLMIMALPLLQNIKFINLQNQLLVLPIIIFLICLTERTVGTQSKTDLKKDFSFLARNLIFSFIMYLILGGTITFNNQIFSFDILKEQIIAKPEIIIIPIIINFLVGVYTGLRLNELFRFRQLLKR